ncbi:MAG: sedoheptulose 7-phosphate cyclase [Xanthomonadales bacterium]|nr:sedoheptulose 7-phosphate cyclase [Xanthomonadales bacterium]
MSDSCAGNWRIRATREIDYEISSVQDVFDSADHSLLLPGRIEGGRRFVVVDERVDEHHGDRIRRYFADHAVHACVMTVPVGEPGKSMDTWQDLLRALDKFPIHRRDEPIIAIGGGVLTDVVGFVASSYRRGVPHVKVPTTLMGYVDASVGIKTAINFNGSKNRVGSFEPPARVLLDRSLLATLDRRQVLNGVCEIIKLAVIKDAALFEHLEVSGASSIASAFQDAPGAKILDTAIDVMLEELTPNLFEDDLARKVDFGHTFSYGLETHFESDLLHGEAVLLDVLVSTVIAQRRFMLTDAQARRILALSGRLGIMPALDLLDANLMWHSLQDRIEHRNGQQLIPLPTAIGDCRFVNDVSLTELQDAIDTLSTGARCAA